MAQQSTPDALDPAREAPTPRVAVETNGINVIAEAERKGTPRQLFWPWFGANVSVFGLAYGSFLLGFGISFWQAVVAGVVGIVVSFLLCGLVAIAGKRGSAPTLVLSRAAFGVNGNRVILSVIDNGRGIDPRDHQRVFDLFRRSGSQDQPGEGIGLAHVRALAYRLGGTIDVQSTLGEGATFRLNLPALLAIQDAS